jgi:aryl-alcohol dehydrogenase-like predicted oxidoreductase
MEYRKIGDLDVSLIGVGCNQFGPTVDLPTCQSIVRGALDSGVNFF